jgi:hypothetical protein
MSDKLEWIDSAEYHPLVFALSESQKFGTFRIHRDGLMYWPSWSPDCSQDLDALKQEAQTIHDEWFKLSTLTS